MKKLLGLFLAIAAAPAAAEGAASTFSPDQDISCAVWASYIIGANQDEDVRNAYMPVMYLFIGRYESTTGQDFRAAFTAKARELDADLSKLQALDAICEPVKIDVAARFSAWAKEVTAGAAGQ